MIINENKRSYENRCLTLHKEFEQKLVLMGKTTTDESNDESVAGVSGRALLPIMEKNSLHESTQSGTDADWNYFTNILSDCAMYSNDVALRVLCRIKRRSECHVLCSAHTRKESQDPSEYVSVCIEYKSEA